MSRESKRVENWQKKHAVIFYRIPVTYIIYQLVSRLADVFDQEISKMPPIRHQQTLRHKQRQESLKEQSLKRKTAIDLLLDSKFFTVSSSI